MDEWSLVNEDVGWLHAHVLSLFESLAHHSISLHASCCRVFVAAVTYSIKTSLSGSAVKKATSLKITSLKSLLEKIWVLKGTLQVILFSSQVELECPECCPMDGYVPGSKHCVCSSGHILRGQSVDTDLQSGEGWHPRKSLCPDTCLYRCATWVFLK